MKNRIFLILISAVLFCTCLTSCGEDTEIVTDVKFSVYENNGSDMISFYATSEKEVFGEWALEITRPEMFTYFHDSENEKTFGSFLEQKTAAYRTVILQPVSEGEAFATFKTESGESQKEYHFKITVSKDKDGILRITGENITQ